VRARLVAHARSFSLVVAAPHYLVDAASLSALVFAALSGDVGEACDDAPAVESRFPAPYRGVRAWPKVATYVIGQLVDDLRLRLFGARMPAPKDGTTRHVTRAIEGDTLRAVLETGRRHECTLSGVVSAAAMRVFLEVLRNRGSGDVGVMSFRDLRRRAVPAYGTDETGACLSMVRHVVRVDHGDDWQLAARVSQAIATSGRRGEHFLANLLAPRLLGIAVPMRLRLADVAVSVPVVRWPKKPFVERVRRFAGHVSAIPIAPPISIVAAMSPAGLSLSFHHLDSELDAAGASAIADAVVARLARCGAAS
jgi:hypothetical protein